MNGPRRRDNFMNCIVKASCIWTQLAFFVWKNGLAEGRFFGRSGRILLRRGDVGVQSLQKLVAVNGLGNMVIHACGHGLGRILDKGIGGDCKNGNPGRIGMLGILAASGCWEARMRRVAVRPSMTGIWISMRIAA